MMSNQFFLLLHHLEKKTKDYFFNKIAFFIRLER